MKTYDGLDRVATVLRLNTKGTSESQTFKYYPTGQLQLETNGIDGFVRETQLDELNRPRQVKESGGGLPAPLFTIYGYDEAGNRTVAVDRRGVRTQTEYD